MSNSATLTATGYVHDKNVKQWTVFIDGAGDLTITTPATGNQIFLMGICSAEAAAKNLIFKSGSTTLLSLEMAANQGISEKVDRNGYIIVTPVSGALIVNASAVTTDFTFVLHTYEGTYF